MHPVIQPTPAEKHAALEEVLASETFARSEQLRAFLRFVCEMEAAGRGGELTEYTIGVKALGRPERYSPLEDSSVRTRAYELRQRLHRYYATENPTAPLLIELPKGTYAPRFIAGPPPAELPAEPSAPPLPPPPDIPRPARVSPRLKGFAAGVLLAGALALGWNVYTARTAVDPAVRRAWTPLVTRDPEVLLCVGTPLHLLVSPYMDAVPDGTPKYPAPPETYPLFSRFRNLPKDARLEMQPTQNALPMGSLQALARIVNTLSAFHTRYRILPETNSPLTAMRNRSVILLASPWYSRAAATLLERTPWSTAVDPHTGDVAIVGRGAAAGRDYPPIRGPRGEYQEVFGLVTVLPSDDTADDSRTIVILSGLTSAGTHGAAAFFTSAADLQKLGERFRKDGVTAWPRAYQAVVRCRASEDTQLLSYSYEAHQVIQK